MHIVYCILYIAYCILHVFVDEWDGDGDGDGALYEDSTVGSITIIATSTIEDYTYRLPTLRVLYTTCVIILFLLYLETCMLVDLQ